MPSSYNAPDVICPFYHNDRRRKIICESAVEGSVSTTLNFPSNRAVRDHIDDFCSSRCYEGCPIYRAIMEKYDE